MDFSFMLCKIGSRKILKSNVYIFEPKLDGTRAFAIIDKEKRRLKIINRRNKEISYRYPEFKFWENVKKSCILDGEIVVFNEKGIPDFNLLQQREQLENKLEIEIKSKTMSACFVVFDVIQIGRKKVTGLPLIERKKLLKSIIVKEDENFKEIVFYENGTKLWKIVKKLKLEGIVAKKKDSKYVGERSEDWLKIKNYKSIDAVVIGFTKEKRKISALVLALYKGGKLFYIGRVAAGLDEEKIKLLLKLFKKTKPYKIDNLKTKKQIYFVKPEIVVEVRYLEFTKDKELRAPVLLRLRFDKKPKDCIFENLTNKKL